MKTSAAIVFCVCASIAATSAGASVSHSVGVARAKEDASVQYVEHHQYLETGEHLVTYFTSSGELLATKRLTYPGLPQHPRIEQADFTRDATVTAMAEDGKLRVVNSTSGTEDSFQLPLNENTIVDAGFDSFIRENWESFDNGEPRVFRFAIAGQKRLLSVDLTRESLSADGALFSIRPRNFLVRLLVPEMRIYYDRERRLSVYEGMTNLKLTPGLPKNVTISFNHYESAERLDKPLPAWLP